MVGVGVARLWPPQLSQLLLQQQLQQKQQQLQQKQQQQQQQQQEQQQLQLQQQIQQQQQQQKQQQQQQQQKQQKQQQQLQQQMQQQQQQQQLQQQMQQQQQLQQVQQQQQQKQQQLQQQRKEKMKLQERLSAEEVVTTASGQVEGGEGRGACRSSKRKSWDFSNPSVQQKGQRLTAGQLMLEEEEEEKVEEIGDGRSQVSMFHDEEEVERKWVEPNGKPLIFKGGALRMGWGVRGMASQEGYSQESQHSLPPRFERVGQPEERMRPHPPPLLAEDKPHSHSQPEDHSNYGRGQGRHRNLARTTSAEDKPQHLHSQADRHGNLAHTTSTEDNSHSHSQPEDHSNYGRGQGWHGNPTYATTLEFQEGKRKSIGGMGDLLKVEQYYDTLERKKMAAGGKVPNQQVGVAPEVSSPPTTAPSSALNSSYSGSDNATSNIGSRHHNKSATTMTSSNSSGGADPLHGLSSSCESQVSSGIPSFRGGAARDGNRRHLTTKMAATAATVATSAATGIPSRDAAQKGWSSEAMPTSSSSSPSSNVETAGRKLKKPQVSGIPSRYSGAGHHHAHHHSRGAAAAGGRGDAERKLSETPSPPLATTNTGSSEQSPARKNRKSALKWPGGGAGGRGGIYSDDDGGSGVLSSSQSSQEPKPVGVANPPRREKRVTMMDEGGAKQQQGANLSPPKRTKGRGLPLSDRSEGSQSPQLSYHAAQPHPHHQHHQGPSPSSSKLQHQQKAVQSRFANSYSQHVPSALKKRGHSSNADHAHHHHEATPPRHASQSPSRNPRVQFQQQDDRRHDNDDHEDRPHPLSFKMSGIPMRATKSAQTPSEATPLTSYPRSHVEALQRRTASNGRVGHAHQTGFGVRSVPQHRFYHPPPHQHHSHQGAVGGGGFQYRGAPQHVRVGGEVPNSEMIGSLV